MDYPFKRKGWTVHATQFAEAISHVSDFPLAYAYALFLAISGHILGRSTFIRYATPLFPNHYICLVGPSGLTHKSTVISLSLESLGEERQYAMSPLHQLSTSQGLLQAMQNSGGMALVVLDELASMLAKRRQDFASDLLARIVELYACPMIAGTYTRHDPIEVKHTFLTIIGGTTAEWLRTSLTNSDLMAGFGNRMTFVLGDPRPAKAWPLAPHWASTVDWTRLEGFSGQMRLEDYARGAWDAFYKRFAKGQSKATPFIRTLAERIPEKVLKAAVILSAWNGQTLIDTDTLESAIDWGDYLHESLTRIMPTFEDTEQQILALVKDGCNTRAKLFGHLSHVHTAERVRRAIENLKWLGLLETSEEGVLTSVE